MCVVCHVTAPTHPITNTAHSICHAAFNRVSHCTSGRRCAANPTKPCVLQIHHTLRTISSNCPCLLRHLPVMVRSRSEPLCHSPEQNEPNSSSCARHVSLSWPLLRPCWWYLHPWKLQPKKQRTLLLRCHSAHCGLCYRQPAVSMFFGCMVAMNVLRTVHAAAAAAESM